MCLFPLPNNDVTSSSYKKGVTEFDCGACPECLRKRASVWALRCAYESKLHAHSYMVTLTYDNYLYSDRHSLEERPVNPNIEVNVRDIQLFIKRLRKHFSDSKIKYLCCAEYGDRTHRAHYHLLLFGLEFSDLQFLKKSKRGNFIYFSPTLTRLWGQGICTVDSCIVNEAVSRYCTKYCAKSRSDGTFMLCSHYIGLEPLLEAFNGRSYFVEGREYPIPRVVWQEYIMRKYSLEYPDMDYRYVPLTPKSWLNGSFQKGIISRQIYRAVRDNDLVYRNYLSYWSDKAAQYTALQPSVLQRIYNLPQKFIRYRDEALRVYSFRYGKRKIPVPAPCSHQYAAFDRWKAFYGLRCGDLPHYSCLNGANDTKPRDLLRFKRNIALEIFDEPPDFQLQMKI